MVAAVVAAVVVLLSVSMEDKSFLDLVAFVFSSEDDDVAAAGTVGGLEEMDMVDSTRLTRLFSCSTLPVVVELLPALVLLLLDLADVDLDKLTALLFDVSLLDVVLLDVLLLELVMGVSLPLFALESSEAGLLDLLLLF